MSLKVWSPGDFDRKVSDLPLVAFDLETSGAYPLSSEIVEFAAVKWFQGEVVETYQALFRPSKPMSDFIIGIHGITNEMVAEAPPVSAKIQEIQQFLSGSVVMAHHAPFDLGFITWEFEKAGLNIPNDPVVCTSLLSRAVFPEMINHKLQTLIRALNLHQGAAHRALDDSKACLELGIKCFERMGAETTLRQVTGKQGKNLDWINFSLKLVAPQTILVISEAIRRGLALDVVYDGGSLKGKVRRLTPEGLVRNPDGDYMVAKCHIDHSSKRFYLQRLQDLSLVPSSDAALKS